jgi:hypothetical protein
MNSTEIRAEISKLEDEAKQLLANANFINGAIQTYHKVLNAVITKEQSFVAGLKATAAKDLTAEADKLDPPKT